MKTKIYKSRPLSYRQWGQVKKEMYTLVFVVAGLFALGAIIQIATAYLVALFKV